ncbi:hypothetical protein C8R47DRAFT_303624 [Mycena vitilis]|nr:hypothetical protein C8R47DRAFT_303624 [Mycena vitilis]
MSQRTPADSDVTVPRFTRRTRVCLACVHCRRRKVKCVSATTGGLPPCMPCKRCIKMGLTCTYRSVEAQSRSASEKSSPPHAPTGTPKHPRTKSTKSIETSPGLPVTQHGISNLPQSFWLNEPRSMMRPRATINTFRPPQSLDQGRGPTYPQYPDSNTEEIQHPLYYSPQIDPRSCGCLPGYCYCAGWLHNRELSEPESELDWSRA